MNNIIELCLQQLYLPPSTHTPFHSVVLPLNAGNVYMSETSPAVQRSREHTTLSYYTGMLVSLSPYRLYGTQSTQLIHRLHKRNV